MMLERIVRWLFGPRPKPQAPPSPATVAEIPKELAKLGLRQRTDYSIPYESEWDLLVKRLTINRLDGTDRVIAVIPDQALGASAFRHTIWDLQSKGLFSTHDAELYGWLVKASQDEVQSVRAAFHEFLKLAKASGVGFSASMSSEAPAGPPRSSPDVTAPPRRKSRSRQETEPRESVPVETTTAPKSPDAVTLTDEQRRIVAALDAGRVRFALVTGAAGTGKSVLVRQLLKRRDTLAVAPTGIAAIAIDGTTVHRAFGFPVGGVLTPLDAVRPNSQTREVLSRVERVVIDEVSMLRADYLDGIDACLRAIRKSNRPFGGVQVVMVGDPFQLPPVTQTTDEEHLAALGLRTPFFYSAQVVKRYPPLHFELRLQHRQSDDAVFLGILNRIRRGHHHEGDLAALNARLTRRERIGKDALVLCARNADAKTLNQARLSALGGKLQEYVAEDQWPSPDKPADGIVRFKIGARVLFTKNDRDGRWMNGTRGEVVGMTNSRVLVRLEEGKVMEVEPATWELREPAAIGGNNGMVDVQEDTAPDGIADESDDPFVDTSRGDVASSVRSAALATREQSAAADDAINSRVIGRYRQIPLRLGWAITIHKSQGMTLSSAVIDLGRGGFATGQVYVALSRMRRLSDVSLVTRIGESDIKVEQSTEAFFRWCQPKKAESSL